MKKHTFLFITDIHQNIDALAGLNFSDYDGIFCGGDIIDPSNCDLSKAEDFLKMLPRDTFIIPGNCDTDTNFLQKILLMNKCIEKKILTTGWGFPIGGIGKARDLKNDISVYRDYFTKDKTRVHHFLNAGGPEFILKFSGVTKDGMIIDNSEIIEKNTPFFNKFISFTEREIENIYPENALRNGILLSHSPAFGHLDELPGLPHIGSSGVAAIINKAKPSLVLSGHFHELPGKETIDGVTYFNPGALKDNKYGIIEYLDGIFTCASHSL